MLCLARALLYSEKGSVVHLHDTKNDAMKSVLQEAQETESVPDEHIHIHDTIDDFIKAFKIGQPRLLIMSLPHGTAADGVIDQLEPYLNKGDIILDGGNEYYKSTERRQERVRKLGVAWLGVGVSGGYQASRRGPSMSPGGDKAAYEKLEPLMKTWAAKDKNGVPCVAWVGPHGAGHYVKMVCQEYPCIKDDQH